MILSTWQQLLWANQQVPQEQPPLAFLLMQNFLSHNVTVKMTQYLGRPAFKVSLNESSQSSKKNTTIDNGHVEVPLTNFYQGMIDVNIAAERSKFHEGSSASAGLIFRKQSNDQYDLVYLKLSPIINNSTVRYVSPPQWNSPSFHASSGIRLEERRWIHLQILVRNNTISVYVDGHPVLTKIPLMGANYPGSIAYWVDGATDAYFTNLHIREF